MERLTKRSATGVAYFDDKARNLLLEAHELEPHEVGALLRKLAKYEDLEEQGKLKDADNIISELEDYGNEEMDYYKGTPYESCIETCVNKAINIVKSTSI